jgi:hypothetical protein
MGNNDRAAGNIDAMHIREFRHPRTHPVEARLVQELGEAEYMRRARVEAVAWIGARPGKFLALTVSRTTQFWLGPFDRPLTALAVTGLTILALLGAWRSLPAMAPPKRAALMIPKVVMTRSEESCRSAFHARSWNRLRRRQLELLPDWTG